MTGMERDREGVKRKKILILLKLGNSGGETYSIVYLLRLPLVGVLVLMLDAGVVRYNDRDGKR